MQYKPESLSYHVFVQSFFRLQYYFLLTYFPLASTLLSCSYVHLCINLLLRWMRTEAEQTKLRLYYTTLYWQSSAMKLSLKKYNFHNNIFFIILFSMFQYKKTKKSSCWIPQYFYVLCKHNRVRNIFPRTLNFLRSNIHTYMQRKESWIQQKLI